ncbi:MAG: alcohol dehydrogenase catalytic domain-containing protein [Alphaproteobacteria bacterium]
MRAARYHTPGQPLRIETIPDPVLRPGSAIVRVLAVFVPPYFQEMVESVQPYGLPPLPFTPGMDSVGVVEQVADDVRGLEVGQKVFCDHYYTATNLTSRAESCYIGVFGKGQASQAILAHWRDGAFAEKMILPAECFTPLGPADSAPPSLLVRLGWIGTCYGGFLRADFRPGNTVVINAATGLVGTCGVLLSLAMGAAKIVAVGRKRVVLEELVRIDPARIVSVPAEAGAEAIAKAAGGAHIMLDCVGDIADPSSTMNALQSLGPFGTAILVGGLNAPLAVNAKWILDQQVRILGSSWFPRGATGEMLGMIGRGVLDLGPIRAREFPLDRVNDAIAAAAKGPGGLDHMVLVP